jgi:hypothetical protein
MMVAAPTSAAGVRRWGDDPVVTKTHRSGGSMKLQLTFGDIEVHVSTTSTLTRLLAATHRRHATPEGETSLRSVNVRIAPPDRSPEQALRIVQREIASHVAAVGQWSPLAALVVERDGRALALAGAPGCGKSTIAAHLLGRGFRLVADDVAFVDVQRALVIGHHALMMFRSGAIPHLPPGFRATLERSSWFTDENGELQFYEVDPASAFGPSIWSAEAILDALVFIERDASADSVRTVAPETTGLPLIDGTSMTLSQFPNVRVGVVGTDRSMLTADRIEHWFDVHVGA